jgi:hypothetical protein
MVPSGLDVLWTAEDIDHKAWLPVCIESQTDLPPPEELRALTLDVLTEILGSARPLSMIVMAYLARKGLSEGARLSALDPLRRVDTSAYLLMRTRRVSAALRALADRLAEPFASEESLVWRLKGPCGAQAVIEAIAKEFGHGTEEYRFFIAELCMELRSIDPAASAGCLDPSRVRSAIVEFIQQQAGILKVNPETSDDGMSAYIEKALGRIMEPV